MNVHDLEPDDYEVTEESLYELDVGELLHLSNRAWVYAQTDKNREAIIGWQRVQDAIEAEFERRINEGYVQ